MFSDKLFTFLSELKSNTELEPILVEMLTSLINLRNSNWGHNTNTGRYQFSVWLQNRSISTGLEPVLSHTEKSCIASYYWQFSTNIKIKIIRYQFINLVLWYLLSIKTGFNLIFFHLNIRGKLSIVRFDKYYSSIF